MILNKKVFIKKNTYMKKYYESKGYIYKDIDSDYMEVKIEDLPLTSNAKVEVVCDFCGKVFTQKYCKYVSAKDSGVCCYNCRSKKAKTTNLLKYGVENISQLESVKEKRKNTFIERYGVENTSQLESVKEKTKKTCIEKYGVPYVSQNELFKQKAIETNIKIYGCKNPMQNDDIKAKIRKSLYNNQSCPSSKAQRYLCELYNGILNYPVKCYNLDILLDDNIYIEYNGSGHDLCVKMEHISQNDFINREIKRFTTLKDEGFKMILYINKTDKLPDDKFLLDAFDFCTKFLKETDAFKVEVDLDNKIIKV